MNGYGIGKDLCRQRALGLFGQRSKTGCVVHGDVSQDLAIQGDAGADRAANGLVASGVKPGDRVEVEVSGIGVLVNTVAAEEMGA